VCAKDHQIRRIRNWEHKTGSIRNKRAGEQVRFWFGFQAAHDGQNRRGQHDRRGVIRKQCRDDCPGDIHEQEESLRRASGVPCRDVGDPFEHALLAGQLGQNHHARKEKINVQAFVDGAASLSQREQTGSDQKDRTAAGPISLGDPARTKQHAENTD